MFCFQCEQTAGCKACAGSVVVCGKKADTAELQDKLTGVLIGLARATEGNEHVVSDSTAAVIVEGLFATLTNVNFDNDTLLAIMDRVDIEKKKLVPECYKCASACGRNNDYCLQQLWNADEDIRSIKSLIPSVFVVLPPMPTTQRCWVTRMNLSISSCTKPCLPSVWMNGA